MHTCTCAHALVHMHTGSRCGEAARRTCAVLAASLRAFASFIAWTGLRVSEAITPSSKSYLYDVVGEGAALLTLNGWELTPQAMFAQGQRNHRSAAGVGQLCSVWPCDQLFGALYQVSVAGSALCVAVGNCRRHRCKERVCVELQRLQRLQQPERRRLLRRRLRCRRLLRSRLLRRRILCSRLLRCRRLSWNCSATIHSLETA